MITAGDTVSVKPPLFIGDKVRVLRDDFVHHSKKIVGKTGRIVGISSLPAFHDTRRVTYTVDIGGAKFKMFLRHLLPLKGSKRVPSLVSRATSMPQGEDT